MLSVQPVLVLQLTVIHVLNICISPTIAVLDVTNRVKHVTVLLQLIVLPVKMVTTLLMIIHVLHVPQDVLLVTMTPPVSPHSQINYL
jgi:hypothetical protein